MTPASPLPPPPDSASELLDEVLNPLLADFQESFDLGLKLLQECPETVLAAPLQSDLHRRLVQANAELQSARALRQAAPVPMALDMALIQAWHRLVLEVWALSAARRRAP